MDKPRQILTVYQVDEKKYSIAINSDAKSFTLGDDYYVTIDDRLIKINIQVAQATEVEQNDAKES